MSFVRLNLLALPVVLGLPLLTGACGAPLALTAASYGADGVSLAETNKTATDHFASMVTKKDCALWRVFSNQKFCRPRDGDHDPYDVNYDEPFRQEGEGGTEYLPPAHAAADAPPTSWDTEAYAAAPKAEVLPPSGPAVAPTNLMPAAQAVALPLATAVTEKPAVKHAAMAKRKPFKKKRAPGQAVIVP
ncbi:MAG: hypothetical protein JSR91_14615 [Proteobacteria bacterium]|nr:hypothetical protein [Pseudomonadota bacterium]